MPLLLLLAGAGTLFVVATRKAAKVIANFDSASAHDNFLRKLPGIIDKARAFGKITYSTRTYGLHDTVVSMSGTAQSMSAAKARIQQLAYAVGAADVTIQ